MCGREAEQGKCVSACSEESFVNKTAGGISGWLVTRRREVVKKELFT